MTKYFDFESDSELLTDKDLEIDQPQTNMVFAKESEFY